jgi:hypothetical protein
MMLVRHERRHRLTAVHIGAQEDRNPNITDSHRAILTRKREELEMLTLGLYIQRIESMKIVTPRDLGVKVQPHARNDGHVTPPSIASPPEHPDL